MSVRPLARSDVDWLVERLAERRRSLTPFAPTLWRPAPDAAHRHRAFLSHLLTDGGGAGVRTDDAFVLAQPGGQGWVVDDAVVPDDEWTSTGVALWHELGPRLPGIVRWVSPVPEPDRRAFAAASGFELVESWWHRGVDGALAAPRDAGPVPAVGSTASLVLAPPIYAPGGPVLFLRDVSEPMGALRDALRAAPGLGAPIVVVSQPAADDGLAEVLVECGFTRHCDFLDT